MLREIIFSKCLGFQSNAQEFSKCLMLARPCGIIWWKKRGSRGAEFQERIRKEWACLQSAALRVFSWFRITLPIRIWKWPARLRKFKARLSSDSPESDKQKSRTRRSGTLAWLLVFGEDVRWSAFSFVRSSRLWVSSRVEGGFPVKYLGPRQLAWLLALPRFWPGPFFKMTRTHILV